MQISASSQVSARTSVDMERIPLHWTLLFLLLEKLVKIYSSVCNRIHGSSKEQCMCKLMNKQNRTWNEARYKFLSYLFIFQLILFRRLWKLFNYSSCCRCHFSDRSYYNRSRHCGRVGIPSKTTQVQGVHCVSWLPMGLGWVHVGYLKVYCKLYLI